MKISDIYYAIDFLNLNNKEICIHSSMKSFGEHIEGGVDAIIDLFISSGCTILAPTFSDMYETKPIEGYMPLQNGAGDYSYFLEKEYENIEPFNRKSKEITVEDMGILAKRVLDSKGSIRGNHPLNAATIIHYAEQLAGRNPFIRWAKNEVGEVIPCLVGGCSEGFGNLEESLKNYAKKITVGQSNWTCYKARHIVNICREVIISNPHITHCGDYYCHRCNDAEKGGPDIDVY